MPERIARWALLLSLAVFASGCSSFSSTVKGWFTIDDEDDLTQPFELEDIDTKIDIDKMWSTSIGNGEGKGYYHLRPVLGDDVLFAAAADGEVVALDADNGKKQWKRDLKTSLAGGVGYYDGSIFLGSADGVAMRLSADSGETLWSTKLTSEILAPPAADGRIVVVQSYDGKVHGLDFEDGSLQWTYDSNVPVLTLRGTSAPILVNGLAIAGFANGRVAAFDARSGALAWELRVTVAQGRSEIERIIDVDGTMELVGTTLFAVSYQGNLVAIEAPSGRKLWQQEASSWTGVGEGFGNVYIAEENGVVTAYQRNGQGQRWQHEALGWRKLSRPTPVNSYVAVGDYEGYVHFLYQVDGSEVGRIKVDGKGIRADMLGDGNRLFVFGNSGKLVALSITARED